MFIEGNASMIILVPLLAPIAAQYGIDEIQFAMVYIFNNAIGALSPPMGTLMFVTCSITMQDRCIYSRSGSFLYFAGHRPSSADLCAVPDHWPC